MFRLDEAMSAHIRLALQTAEGRINGRNGAAALLDIHPNTLRNRMRKLGIRYGRGTASSSAPSP
jgi:transcriptional regulator of acetoin/glycerol metabolism